MDIEKREELLNFLLTYMKKKAEKVGSIDMSPVDFSISHNVDCIGYPSENMPDGEDLQNLKKIIDISDNDIQEILNYCFANKYIRFFGLNSDAVVLTQEGFYKAKEYENEEVLQNKLQRELIYIETYKSNDIETNNLLIKAKQAFLEDDIQTALEKIWDAFERVKTLCDIDKRTSVQKICKALSYDLSFDVYNDEYALLTKLGNNYQIRHFETYKKEIKGNETKKYLFFRVLSLINLTLERIK